MNSFETVRLIAEVISVVGAVCVGMGWLIRLAYRILANQKKAVETLELVHDKQSSMNGSVLRHFEQDDARFQELKVEMALIKGRMDERDLRRMEEGLNKT